MRRLAAHRMIIEGNTYINHVAEFNDNGILICHYPLTHELPMCEWRNLYDQQS